MSDHALSQEEIDALLRGETLPDAAAMIDLEPLVGMFQAIVDQMAPVVSPVAGQQFKAGRVVAELMSWDDVKGRLVAPLVSRLDFRGELQGVQLSIADGSTQQQLRALSPEEPVTVLNKMVLALVAGLEEQLGLDLDTEISSFEPIHKDNYDKVPWHSTEMCAVFDLGLHSHGGDVAWREVLPQDVAVELLQRLPAEVRVPPTASSRPTEAAQEQDPIGLVPPIGVMSIPTPPPLTTGSPGSGPVTVAPVQFAPLGGSGVTEQSANIGLIMDVPLQVTVELGRKRMLVRDVLELGKGSLIELEKLAGEPVDVFINGKLIAKGEVVVIDENFGVKVTTVVTPVERLQHLQ